MLKLRRNDRVVTPDGRRGFVSRISTTTHNAEVAIDTEHSGGLVTCRIVMRTADLRLDDPHGLFFNGALILKTSNRQEAQDFANQGDPTVDAVIAIVPLTVRCDGCGRDFVASDGDRAATAVILHASGRGARREVTDLEAQAFLHACASCRERLKLAEELESEAVC